MWEEINEGKRNYFFLLHFDFIFIVFFLLLLSTLIHSSPQKLPHCCPCPWVLFPFCSVPPLTNLPSSLICHPALQDGLGEHYAKWNKPVREKQISYDFTYMWNVKKNMWNKQNRKRLIDTDWWLPEGRGCGTGWNGEGIKKYRLVATK